MISKWITTAMVLAAGLSFAKVEPHWDGGRNMPVHRLAVNDELGDTIVPTAPNALPVSTRKTCGQCHDYETIASGWHFNMSNADQPSGRSSEPWFLVDGATGSQIPMGLRNWTGLYKPEQLGMSNWEFVLAFGRHMPGGDIADPEDRCAEGGANARWNVSGPIEINCFACHSQDKEYDHSEWVRQVARHNFRWAATGALGLGDVGGMGSRVDDYWGMLRGLNPDDSLFKVPPHMNYNLSKFDAKNRVVLDLGKPRNENCLSCHSTTQAGMHAKDIDGDVHLRAGMTCSDCHGNGLDHATARGFVGDNTGAMDKVRATASCTGCHNGTDTVKAGRHGAPAPKHVGYPAVHFEKLNCTVCHSGVTENGELAQVRTSRSNRMGVYGRARWATPQPFIMEPVFVKDECGKITPSRMVWPAFWATRDEADKGKLNPILPEVVAEACKNLFDVREQVGGILMALSRDPNISDTPVAVVDGSVLAANIDDIAVVVDKTDWVNGVYYKTPTNLIQVLPEFEEGTDMAQEEPLKNLLQTLDAAPAAETMGFAALWLGNQIYYRGGVESAVVMHQADETAAQLRLGWFDAEEKKFSPLLDETVLKRAVALAGTDYSFTEEMMCEALGRLSVSGVKNPVYVAHGKVWSYADGKLTATEEKAAAAISWAIGHDVRPARMARGAKPVKCADCHTVDSTFFFGKVESTGPLMTMQKTVKTQCEYMGISGSYNRLFGTTFLVRPLFKIFLWVVFAFVCLVAIAFAAAAIPSVFLNRQTYETYGKSTGNLIDMADKFSAWGLVLAVIYLALSGVAGWFFHLMTGYVLVFHMVAGGLFSVCLLALIWFRGKKRIKDVKRSVLWMLMLVLGVCVLFTAVAPMMTWFGEGWQKVLLQGHRCSTMCFIALSVWMFITGGRKE